jgi:hypothetical protein
LVYGWCIVGVRLNGLKAENGLNLIGFLAKLPYEQYRFLLFGNRELLKSREGNFKRASKL